MKVHSWQETAVSKNTVPKPKGLTLNQLSSEVTHPGSPVARQCWIEDPYKGCEVTRAL